MNGEHIWNFRQQIGLLFRRYRAYFPSWKGYRKYLGHILIFMVTATVVGIVPALLQRKVFDHAIPAGDRETLVFILIGLVVINVLIFILTAISDFILSLIIEEKRLRIIVSFFEKLLYLDHQYYNSVSLGEVNRLYRDGDQLGESGRILIMEMVNGLIVALFYYPILFFISWPLTVIRLLIFPINFLVGSFFIRKDRELERLIWEKGGKISTHINETFKGIRTIKVFGAENRIRNTAENNHYHLKRLLIRRRRYSFLWGAVQNLISGIINGIVFFVAASTIINGDFSFGAFIAFNIINGQAQQSVSRLFGGYKKLVQGFNSVDRFDCFLRLPNENSFDGRDSLKDRLKTKNPKFSKNILNKKGKEIIPEDVIRGEIQIRNLSFSYNRKNSALNNITLNIPAGTNCAIVGRSGAGKSTITNLLMGFYSPSEGNILIDGKNIGEMSRKELRNKIGIVQQDNFFFNHTIRENLIFGNRQVRDQEIWSALKRANALGFIKQLEKGLDTVFGEKGTNFSGGQKQRLAIARLFLRNPGIVILDEATSSLDTEGEFFIRQSLGKLCKGRTTITIAHRLSTIVNSDIIYVLDRGRVAEKGTHLELLKNQGIYSRLFHSAGNNNTGYCDYSENGDEKEDIFVSEERFYV